MEIFLPEMRVVEIWLAVLEFGRAVIYFVFFEFFVELFIVLSVE